MSTFTISKWFTVEADSYEDAWKLADGPLQDIANVATDEGTIDVEQGDEDE